MLDKSTQRANGEMTETQAMSVEMIEVERHLPSILR
jgi:hypothetical protein